jgi:type III restriction enzyme
MENTINTMKEKSPILNNPYEEPRWHYSADLDGNLDYNEVLEGRRPYTAAIGIAPNQPQIGLFTHDDMPNDDPNASFINSLRDEVKKWREGGYPHVTRVTRELLNFWFCNPERQNFQRLFFCQQEAVETAVYLNEVANFDSNTGRDLLRQLEERRQTVHDEFAYVLPRTAFKMATGTGKTVVMAMLILYNYLNKREHVQDTRFADHFLIVAPGITIRDRLGVLFIDERSVKAQFDDEVTDYYHKRGLIPRNYEAQLGGLNACITIINYHQFEQKQYQGKKQSPMDGKLVYKSGEGMVKQQDKEKFSAVISRILGRMPKSKRIIVINDEAHHCYLPKLSDKKASREEADENQKAMVWYEGIRQMKLLGYKVQHVYDLSATPYYLKGSGYPEYSLFPWVVSDFGLVDAIESGLVKIPFLPSADDTIGLTDPVLRNIYEHISQDLPKKGQKAKKAEDKKNGKDMSESAPNLPALLNTAIDQFVRDYEDYERGTREEGEAAKNIFSTPPVFIVVCNNTSVSKEVFKMMAGYESVDAEGNTIYVPGRYDVFSNYKDGMPLKKQPALLIDSAAIEDAGSVVSDEFKRIYSTEIEQFKRDYATLHGAGSADQLTDGDILREVVNSVGKPNTLGANIRLVVSVSMLTEGWDANTVTHVCGVRAFGSQLLCEQVAGRALRRRSYELLPYTLSGEEIDAKDVKRYKPENIVWKFPPEYAHIIGVPFKTFKGGGSGVTPPTKPKTQVFAMDERKAMEITFPNIIGYRSQTTDGRITADFTNVPKFQLDFNEVPTQTTLSSAVDGKRKVVLKSNYYELRDAQVVFELTRWLINLKYTDPDKGRQFQLFAALKAVVQQWYDSQIEVIGGDGSKDLRRLAVFWQPTEVVASINEGIRAAAKGDERITAILHYHNPEGSTRYVYGATSKEVYPTQKSHVNYVVADTDSWEQICAKTLEDMTEVECYVKNAFLNFCIPYMIGTEEHRYMPDFIARVKGGNSGETVNLVIEISGFSNDRTGNKDKKQYYTMNYWLPAANNLKTYGRWDFIEISDIYNIRALLTEKIKQL